MQYRVNSVRIGAVPSALEESFIGIGSFGSFSKRNGQEGKSPAVRVEIFFPYSPLLRGVQISLGTWERMCKLGFYGRW